MVLIKADKEALFELLFHDGWKYLNEIQYWLYHERDFNVICITIHYVLKKEKRSKKAIRCMAQGHDLQLKELYCNNIKWFLANIMVFFDEAIFNEKTGWWTKR